MKSLHSLSQKMCAAFVVVLFSFNAGAQEIYDLNYTFSGTSPVGPAPWVEVAFQDVTPGTVLLTVTNSNLTGSEFDDSVYLNFNPAKNVTQLSFTLQSETPGLTSLSTSTGANAFKADGDGDYDILLGFETSNSGGERFMGGDYVTYQITDLPDLITASDFAFVSQADGGTGTYYAAAHIQASGNSGGWIGSTQAVPEPGYAGFLVLVGGLCWGARRRG